MGASEGDKTSGCDTSIPLYHDSYDDVAPQVRMDRWSNNDRLSAVAVVAPTGTDRRGAPWQSKPRARVSAARARNRHGSSPIALIAPAAGQAQHSGRVPGGRDAA